ACSEPTAQGQPPAGGAAADRRVAQSPAGDADAVDPGRPARAASGGGAGAGRLAAGALLSGGIIGGRGGRAAHRRGAGGTGSLETNSSNQKLRAVLLRRASILENTPAEGRPRGQLIPNRRALLAFVLRARPAG